MRLLDNSDKEQERSISVGYSETTIKDSSNRNAVVCVPPSTASNPNQAACSYTGQKSVLCGLLKPPSKSSRKLVEILNDCRVSVACVSRVTIAKAGRLSTWKYISRYLAMTNRLGPVVVGLGPVYTVSNDRD